MYEYNDLWPNEYTMTSSNANELYVVNEFHSKIQFIVTAPPQSNLAINANQKEILRVAEDGFYVRGVKVEADENEAKAVYKAFKQWLVEAALRRE